MLSCDDVVNEGGMAERESFTLTATLNHSSYTVDNSGRQISGGFVLVFASCRCGHRAELVPSWGCTQSPLCPLSLCYLAAWANAWTWLPSSLTGKRRMWTRTAHKRKQYRCEHTSTVTNCCLYAVIMHSDACANMVSTVESLRRMAQLHSACIELTGMVFLSDYTAFKVTHLNHHWCRQLVTQLNRD